MSLKLGSVKSFYVLSHFLFCMLNLQGSHNGYMKSWDLQSGELLRAFGAQSSNDDEGDDKAKKRGLKVHKGPVRVVYIHDCLSSLAFSGSANELLVWKLDEGILVKVLADHSRPVSAICCFQLSDTASDKKHPASLVSGGDDSCLMIYSLKDFSLTSKLDNKAGPINDIKIPLVALNGTKEMLPVIVAACFDGSVQLWSLSTGMWLAALDLPFGPVNALCVLPTPAPGLVTGHSDGSVLLINLQTLEVLTSLSKKNAETSTQPQTLAFLSKGRDSCGEEGSILHSAAAVTVSCTMFPRPLILAGFQGPEVYVWDLDVGETEEARELKDILVLDLLWKDPLLAHHSDSEDDKD